MDIIYSLRDTNQLFKSHNLEDLKTEIEEFYSYHGAKPVVNTDGEYVHVHIDTENLEEADENFKKAIDACQKRDFDAAIPFLKATLKICPHHTDAHRMLAQIAMENGDIHGAIDRCIDALRWNPRDVNSLILMGNLFGKQGDTESADEYYSSALKYEPQNPIALTNAAALKLQLDKFDEAIPLFEDVLKIDKTYLNPAYGLALAHYKRGQQGDLEKAYDIALNSLLTAEDRVENPQIREETISLLKALAELLSHKDYRFVIEAVLDKVGQQDSTEVRFAENPKMDLAAKLEYSRSYNRKYHLIVINSTKPYVDHLKMHELMHLDMMTLAQKDHKNKMIYSSQEQRQRFRKRFDGFMKKHLARMGGENYVKMMDNVCNGLVLQVMNCPLDLFVEDKIYQEYQVMRPVQMLSLFAQEMENIASINRVRKGGMFPPAIVSANKIMNMVTSMHFTKLYGLNMVGQYNPTKMEYECAKDLYEEYEAYHDYKPGEEYDLVEYFAESLQTEDWMTITLEDQYFGDHEDSSNEENYKLLDKLEEASQHVRTPEEQRKQEQFNKNHEKKDPMVTMMMSMYMLGAMETFETWSKEEVHKAAFEIALLGTKGLDPSQKSGYRIPSLPDKDMGGYQMLAYYYVSWAISEPYVLPKLNLNMFDDAYAAAKQMYELKKKNRGSK
jgi:tetratricopeptide (TPR) repeat protein